LLYSAGTSHQPSSTLNEDHDQLVELPAYQVLESNHV